MRYKDCQEVINFYNHVFEEDRIDNSDPVLLEKVAECLSRCNGDVNRLEGFIGAYKLHDNDDLMSGEPRFINCLRRFIIEYNDSDHPLSSIPLNSLYEPIIPRFSIDTFDNFSGYGIDFDSNTVDADEVDEELEKKYRLLRTLILVIMLNRWEYLKNLY